MNKNQYLILAISLLFSTSLLAGGIRGKITDEDGLPLPFTTIYVTETGSGTITNQEGYYELRIDPGRYTIVFQYLGYITETRKVDVGSGFSDYNVALREQVMELKTVEIYEGSEDPAYTVMRKAIAKASFHRQQIDRYEAQVYIKGTGRMNKIPRLFRKQLEKEGVDTSAAFTSESVSEIYYERPNTFKEKVISIYQTGEDNSTSPNSYINSSFYHPEIVEAISPLSPKAFAYYKFKLDGYFVDRGYGVNKIRVTPRSRGENVFEGHIYIVEDYWSIYSLSLKTYKFGFGFLIDQVYEPIEEEAWMPVSHKFFVDGKIFGFGIEYNYLATVSDYKISINPDLDYEVTVIDEKIEKEMARSLAEKQKDDPKTGAIEEKLSTGQELTRKELRKMLREYEKEEQKEQEEPEVIVNSTYEVDSMATKRDSLYWETIRPVPLTSLEVRGYALVDSLAKVEKEEQEEEQIEGVAKRRKNKKGKFNPSAILLGNTYKLAKNHTLAHTNFLDKIHFNPVEGFNITGELVYTYRNRREDLPDNRLRLNFKPRYAFARDKFVAKGGLFYDYGKRLRRSRLQVEGGTFISQFNDAPAISQYINSYLNLFEERNFIRLYEKQFVQFKQRHKIKENWTLRGEVEWAERRTLSNNTSQVWFGKDDRSYAPNIPLNNEVFLPEESPLKAFTFSLGVEARPWQKYKIHNGRKSAINYTSPTLGLTYRKGVDGLLNSEVDFDMIDFSIQHAWRVRAAGKFDFKLNSGIFLNKNKVGFADFKHFLGNRTVLVTTDPVGSYRLLDYYQYSTRDKYLSAHLHYQFRKLLATQIMEVWMLGIKENVFVNYLATPTNPSAFFDQNGANHYFELGYSIDNILRVFRIEAAASFQNGKYQDWGILIGVASNLGFISFD